MGSEAELTDPQELLEAGWRARFVDDRHDIAHDLILRSLELARSRQDKRATAKALLALSKNLLWYCPQEIEESDLSLDRLCEDALELFRAIGDESGVAASLRALARYSESLAICRRINDQQGVILSLYRLQDMAALQEAVSLARQLGDNELLADVLKTAGICWESDDCSRRTVLLEAAELYDKLQYRRNCAESLTICALTACGDDAVLKQRLL
jgi:hypothetical protein